MQQLSRSTNFFVCQNWCNQILQLHQLFGCESIGVMRKGWCNEYIATPIYVIGVVEAA